MKLLVVVLNALEYREELLEALLELDVRGVTVIESEEVLHLLAQEVPIFAGLRRFFAAGASEHSRIVLGVSDRPDVLEALDATLKEVGVNLSTPGIGYAIALTIDGIIEPPPEE